MYFNSYEFIFLFLPIVLSAYYALNKFRWYKAGTTFLLGASVLFYAWFNIKALEIIVPCITINYFLGKVLTTKREITISKKLVLSIGIILNIGILAYFKYYNFFLGSLAAVLHKDYVMVNLLVPVGISFFTFQQIAFLVDASKEKLSYSYIEYALHSIFFPYIISGPIVRHNQIIPQFSDLKRKVFSYANFGKGFVAFSIGLSKKVLIADTLAKVVNIGYSNVYDLNSTTAIIVMLSYTFQIYFDFSGYSDMVIGIGKMLNLDLPVNFNSPYKACTIGEFWKRWHMSLTNFLTKYLYISLGGSRKGKIRTYVNVMIVFLISGLWHGANWTFVIWGLMHGVASVLDRIGKKYVDQCSNILKWIVTFGFINISWIVFRAANMADAIYMIKLIINGNYGGVSGEIVNAFILPEVSALLEICNFGIATINTLIMNIILFSLLFICVQAKNVMELLDKFKYSTKVAFICAVLLTWSILSFTGIPTFIYVNF